VPEYQYGVWVLLLGVEVERGSAVCSERLRPDGQYADGEHLPDTEETPMLDPKAQEAVGLRLRRIEGQVRGIARMVAEPRLCVDLLTQIAAVQSALKSVGDEILHYHVQRCVPDSFSRRLRNSERARLEELEKVFVQYCKEPRT
jgi:DNA-binding FrmR family transcriptional regulator